MAEFVVVAWQAQTKAARPRHICDNKLESPARPGPKRKPLFSLGETWQKPKIRLRLWRAEDIISFLFALVFCPYSYAWDWNEMQLQSKDINQMSWVSGSYPRRFSQRVLSHMLGSEKINLILRSSLNLSGSLAVYYKEWPGWGAKKYSVHYAAVFFSYWVETGRSLLPWFRVEKILYQYRVFVSKSILKRSF